MKESPAVVSGKLVYTPGARFAIVASRFNELIVKSLVEGAREGLSRFGVPEDAVTEFQVPGAFELGPVCMRLARSGRFQAVIALGAVIRGSTAHFDYVAGEAASAISAAARETGVPVSFGVLTTDTIEQAIERAGTKAGNKGLDAAMVALEMVSLGKILSDQGL